MTLQHRTGVFQYVALITCAFLCGCSGGENAIEQRAEEFRYAPQSLADELVPRLRQAAASYSSTIQQTKKGSEVASLEADRGGDGDRPNPNSLDAIVADTVSKLQSMDADATGTVSSEQVDALMQIIQAASDLPGSIKTSFGDKLRAATAGQ